MKKLFLFVVMSVAVILTSVAVEPTPPFDTSPQVEVVMSELPDLPVLPNPSDYVVTFFAFASTVLLLTSLVNKLFKLSGQKKQYLSWAVSLIVGFTAWFFKWGIFAGVGWYIVILYCFLFALGANGIFDWSVIRKILILIGLEKEPPNKDKAKLK